MRPLFNVNLQATDLVYINLRDTKSLLAYKNFAEKLWVKYHPYADSNFLIEIGNSFHERFWEMYLACTLLQNNICLEKKRTNKGPDIQVKFGISTIWIEATAPRGGDPDKPDSVVQPLMTPGKIVGGKVPDDQIILRYRNTIQEKYNNKYNRYLTNDIISSVDCYVIAINGCQIHCSRVENNIPRIVRSVFPFGLQVVTINTKSHEVVGTSHQYRPSITKASGKSVDTNIFLNQNYQNISAILFSNADVGNQVDPFGQDFVCVRNPYALNPLPNNFLCIGSEYSVSIGNMILNHKNWRDIQ